jgi:hypothetical protein
MTRISIVTAVSRPENLQRLHESIATALGTHPVDVTWIIIFNAGPHEPIFFPASRFDIERHFFGEPNTFGLLQKNHGIAQVRDGWYYLLDDDNILHPRFFEALLPAIDANPGKQAFVFGQQRWDRWGNLKAAAENMEPNKIDNSMFLVRRDFIGDERYNLEQVGIEDYFFFRKLFDKNPSTFVFLDEVLAFYNFLRR